MPKEKQLITLKHFQNVQMGLNIYVDAQLGVEDDSNYRTHALVDRFRRAFERSSGLSAILNAHLNEEELTLERMHEVRMNIYRSLGAPGDWGYGTDIGEALKHLYSASAKPPETDKSEPTTYPGNQKFKARLEGQHTEAHR